jgi:hypothetical protein
MKHPDVNFLLSNRELILKAAEAWDSGHGEVEYLTWHTYFVRRYYNFGDVEWVCPFRIKAFSRKQALQKAKTKMIYYHIGWKP